MPVLGLDNITGRIMRAGEGRILRRLQRIAAQVNSLEEEFKALTDEELQALTPEFTRRHADGESLDDLLPEAFATMREAARRTLGMRHFDVQLMGGAALHFGNIAEMQTGEGKTLVGTLPVYLNALTGKGVHLVTVNDYLAERDAEWMGRAYRFLGLTVGVIKSQSTPAERRAQYACDITYGTNTEFGFDYLRDNMAWSQDELVQRGHHFAIVDEADSILIDEARTPLIISGPADQPTQWYGAFAKLVTRMRGVRVQEEQFVTPADKDRLAHLRTTHDYEYDPKKRTVAILDRGVEYLQDQLGIESLYESEHTSLIGHLNNALKAKEHFRKDKDYVVVDGEVLIVDEHTGRILAGRRYNEGLHQAIEAKEAEEGTEAGVTVRNENQTLATITLQNFFRLYEKLAGMTGTAMTEAAEFHQIYQLNVVPIPSNRPMIRRDDPDQIYRTEEAKYAAILADIAERHETGQPILVGTTSVEKSELLSGLLRKQGIRHEVLNAKNHQREAQIVAQAGRRGAVTVATNMAGRGTDIMLGGNPEAMALAALPEDATPEDREAVLDRVGRAAAAEHEEVKELGGLYVLGTERHESRRIDNQLRGRSGRQGDPGASRFYLSLGDDLMRLFRAQVVERVMSMANVPDDVPIENKMVTRAIASAQSQLEQQHFESRKDVLKFDEVLNRQRTLIYAERRRVLAGEDLREQVRHFMDDTIEAYIRQETGEGFPEEWDLERLWGAFRQLYPVGITIEDLEDSVGGRPDLTVDDLVAAVTEDVHDRYARREAELGADALRDLERLVVLSVLDRKWREHLYEMDYLRDGIGLRWTLGREPIVEYEREGFDMFGAMTEAIKEESVGYVFNLDATGREGEGSALDRRPTDGLHFSAPTLDTAEGVVEGRFTTAPAGEPAEHDKAPPHRPGKSRNRRRRKR
ncbi:preprotein translocase subunit SecA [Streptomyces avermitilis]|uniref:Protein translocase subunit SecA 2 n=2 Tax=Streptomyces avermitilis TaxID=33903 RepID=SECA2_STRAW|nr:MULTISPECIES: preprotein translocase subunit SecA [Streptomyces]Q82K39.1 RecName: Full=Protein translocase subunit SecA 2 [Streptomyces avermitilis MA-4680 = NBRC 14893]KUN50047.1 preprotein translocase subunit SecA [Streptomyces avermitilis]MYS98171.1 preprotein translocase subunit SecA [Streptomyces sp. SID5469]OOV33411.1 protein translocase subunit SecA 2 [Streptomyces avermitilis]BAC70276.1 putative preprotein translocase SecA subunit [Streptomyces avermitilis MA-4680 = NBRC 14893]GDY6